jgi:two-component system nitrate/nitrite response regulator NarL
MCAEIRGSKPFAKSVIDFATAKLRMAEKSHRSRKARPARPRIRVVIADGNPIFLHELRCLLHAKAGFAIVAMCQDSAACIACIRAYAPDLAVFETRLPGADAIQVLRTIVADDPHVRPVLLLSSIEDVEQGVRALAMGACGVIPRELAPQALVRRLRQIASGQRLMLLPLPAKGDCRRQAVDGGWLRGDPERSLVALTPREQQISKLVSMRLSNRQIGLRLGIRESTVKTHLNHVFQKFAIRHRTSLADLWRSRFGPSRSI